MSTQIHDRLPHASKPRPSQDLRSRIRAEFGEMPGLRLTLAQASRFFHVDRAECDGVLHDLVRAGELRTDGTGFMAPSPNH